MVSASHPSGIYACRHDEQQHGSKGDGSEEYVPLFQPLLCLLVFELLRVILHVVLAYGLLHVMLVDGVLQCGIPHQMLSCLTGVALLQSFIQPHLRPALVILISTHSASLGSLSEKGGSFGVCTAAVEQLAHLVLADGERHVVAGFLKYGHGAPYALLSLGILLQCYQGRRHLRQAYARSCLVAQQRVCLVGTVGIRERPAVLALVMIDF